MLTEIRLANVRVFVGGPWSFRLAPLTVICGTNSSGKSTVLKSLLMLRENAFRDVISVREQGIFSLSAGDIDLGTYKSLVSLNQDWRTMTFGVSSRELMRRNAYETLPRTGGTRKESPTSDAPLVPYSLSADFRVALQGSDEPPSAAKTRHAHLRSAQFAVTSEDAGSNWTLRRTQAASGLHESFPYTLFFPRALEVPDASAATTRQTGQQRYLTRLFGLLPGALTAPPRRATPDGNPEIETRTAQLSLPPAIDEATGDLFSRLGAVSYLGPLRAPAKRYYMASSDTPPELDPTGEFLPFVLRDRINDQVVFRAPGSSANSSAPLGDALGVWLSYLRTGRTRRPHSKELRVTPTREVLLELDVRSAGGRNMYGLADSGFGFSQVLPILVRILLAPTGGCVLVEQPEVHLNPALQVRLAEFFAAAVRSGRQIVLETHSEHIVNTVRVLVAENHIPADDVAMYYLEARPGRPKAHALDVQSDGSVPEWPRGFFGEALGLTTRLLTAQRTGKP